MPWFCLTGDVVVRIFLLFAALAAILTSETLEARYQSFKIYDLPAPDYPRRCLEEGIECTVMLGIKLHPITGRMERVFVIHKPHDCPEFADAALLAMRRARFYSPPRGHHVTEEVIMVPVNFTLNDD
jgi:TonB family protein